MMIKIIMRFSYVNCGNGHTIAFRLLTFKSLDELQSFIDCLVTCCEVKKINWSDHLNPSLIKATLKTYSIAEYQDVLDIYTLFKATNN